MAAHVGIALVRRMGQKQITVQLSDKACALLEVLETCQAIQRGEVRQVQGDGLLDPPPGTVLGLNPADLEVCLSGGIGMLLACRWGDGLEVMALTEEEGDAIRTLREGKKRKMMLDRAEPAKV